MTTMERRISTSSVRQSPRRKRVSRNRLILALALGALLFLLGLMHTWMYADVSKHGYARAELVAKIKSVEAENQVLRAELERLRNPKRLARIAREDGMVIAETYDRVVLTPSVRMAKADR